MLEVQHPVDYLKKEEVNEPVEGEHIEQQALKRRSTLKRFKRSLDNPDLPENFEISSAIGGGDCFFDSVAKGLKQLKPNMEFTVKSIRQVCKQLAVGNQQLKAKVIRDVRSSHDPTIVLPDSSISDDELWNIYLASIEYTSEDMERMRIENSDLYRSLTSLKYGSALQTPIWGRPDIEGQLICNEYNVKLHIVEKLLHTGWSNQVVDGLVSRSVDNIDYSEVGTIHIINRGTNHFEPILDKTRITVHQSKQSLADNYHSNLGNQPIDSPQHHQINTRSPDSTDYDDEVTPEEELINTVKSNDSEEEKLEKIRRLFEKERKPDINFQDTNGDTSLHITVRKGEGKVVELLIGKGAKINDDSVKNKRGRTPLDVAKRPDMPNGQEISGILEAYINGVSKPSDQDILVLQTSVQQQPQQKRTRSDSGEIDPKKPRISSQATAQVSIGVKRPQNEEVSQAKKQKTGQDYPKGGLAHSLHGNIYQLKLLMLFLKQGLDKKYSFRLATEMDSAEKFDDLVFEYENERKDGSIYRFLQAKHKQNDTKKISVNDLLTETDGEFSLQKYFISYRKIKQNSEFKGRNNELKDFVICTNIDLEENLQDSFEPVEDRDDILDTQYDGKESKRLKFKTNNFHDKENLISILENTSDLNRLAKKLAEHVLKDKKIELRDPLFKSYHGALAKEVINIQNKKFHGEFLNDQQLSDKTKAFREALKKEIEKQGSNLQAIKDTPLKLSSGFGGKAEHTNLPNDDVTDQEIKDFFEKLIFAVNQPNETELGEIIEAKMGEDKDINLIDSEFAASKFQKDMLNWMKAKEGRFLTHEDGKAFFNEAKQKISKLVLIGPTLEYRAKIEDFGIAFSEEPSELSNFLASRERQIFNLINPHKTILSSIKVCQTLKGIPKYQKDDSYIFIYLSSLFRIQDHAIEAFKSNDLLVIECEAGEKNVDKLYSQLFEIIQSNSNKKIILITQKDNQLAAKFKKDSSDKYIEKRDEKNSLTDLDDPQEKLLKKGKVTFQGEKVSLDTLVDNGSKDLIDGEVLSKLIEDKEITIGTSLPSISDSNSPAYHKVMEKIDDKQHLKNIKGDMFVVSGINEKSLKDDLGIEEGEIVPYNEKIFSEDRSKGQPKFIVLDSEKNDKIVKDFENVCRQCQESLSKQGSEEQEKKLIHLIEFKNDKYIWNRYYDLKFYTDRKFYQIEIDATELDKYVTKSDKKGDIFAVSGIKKEGFEKQYKIDKRVIALFEDNPDGNEHIIILSNGDKEKDFSRLSDDDRLKGSNIHWLESKENKLFWKRSKGKTLELSKMVISKPDLTHNSLLDIVKDTRSTVIADLSGMGKSTTLTHFLTESYKKEKGLDWVIRVNLRDYSSEIDKLPDEYNLKKVVEFFSAIDKEGLEDTFAKKLFKHRLEEKDNVLLLFDGFDEISSGQKGGDTGQSADKQKKITNLLKFLKDKTNARVVVTTRPYEKEKTSLENELSVLSYTFKPIENERQDFLKNFWKRSLKLKYSENEIKESQYEEFAQGLICKFNKAVNEEKSRFMGIPLHLRMLAEVYLEKFEKFCKDRQNDDFKDLNIFDLYKEFVDRKYKIYFSEKAGLSSTGVTNADLDMLGEQYEKMHKRLAFKYLFSGSAEPFKLFFSAESEGSSFIENKMSNEEKIRELKRIGIIQSKSKDDIDFIHHTFAEYFVSKLIYERLKRKLENPNYSQESKDEMRKFLLNYIFIKEENNVIRSFINSELADKSVNLENFWSGQIDLLENKEQLLLAVKEGLGNIFSFLLHSEKDKGINKELISVPRKHIKKLCDDGKYKEANLFSGNALKFLIEELREDHLEIAIMQGYLGNAYGTLAENTKDERKKEELFNKKKEFLEKALSTFKKHLEVAEKRGAEHQYQEDYLQQALSTFKEDLKSIEAQTAKGLDENQRKVWIRVLEIEIAKVKRNLANAYGDLGNHEEKKKFLGEVLSTFEEHGEKLRIAETKRNLGNVYGDLGNHEEKKKFLGEALSTFEEYGEELRIAETKRNLGNVYGKLGNRPERKRLLEEALPVLKNHYGFFNFKVTKAQENLSEVYEKLRYPLHGAVICGNKDKVEEELKKNDVNRKTDDLVTPLHLAVREGHPDIVKLLLEKQADPNIQDKNGEIPLDLTKELLNQNSQIYQEIIDIFKSKSINQQQENHPVNQGSKVLSEECLSSTSHNRKKREAKGECLFTWEDVDKFNEEKDEKRDFSKIEIDSEKFVNYIKDLPEEKRSQLIQLADKVRVAGNSQSLVSKLISNQKAISHLNRVGKISGMTMHGMIAKNVLADFLNGDYQGVAINVGFIAGGQGFAKVAEAASLKGLKLAEEGKALLGSSLKAASPFLARGTSAFVVYDLVNQVKAFKNGTEEALVGVVGDSIYLGVDAAEIGIEIAEAFEVFEGVSSVTGPIGTAIGAVVFVGTDIYMAVKRVDKIDQIIHLKGNERFIEGLRAFIGMQPEKHIEELVEEKQLSNQLVNQGLEYLQQHSDIQRYVFPTGKSVVDSCNKVQQSKRVCVSPGFNGCTRARTVTSYTEKCTTKFEEDLDNTVLLDRRRTDIKWSRAKPDNPRGGQLFCLPQGNYEPAPNYGSYLCKSAIGITDLSTNKTGGYTLINLGEGEDYVKGFIDNPNIFVVNNGSKKYHGGNKGDIFILQGSSITGYFYGEGGVNTLDLTSFAPEKESIDVKLHVGQVEDYYQDNSFGMSRINRFLGRKGKADRMFITCDSSTSDIKFVDGQGGSERFVDHIKIDDKDCAYEMQIVVRPNTVIYNRALKGDFHYIIPYALGNAKVDFIYTAEVLNLNNTFAFEYEPAQIKNVDVRNINVLNKTSHIITFNFSPMSDKEFNITISGASNPSYRLGNNTEIKVGNRGNLYMLENTNKSVDEIIKDYLVVANRLNKMSFFIQSLLSNETVAIGSGNYEVIHNNPLYKSHLVGNGGENVYVIDSGDKKLEVAMPEVVIYDLDVESSVDTIDLRNLVQQANKFSNSFELQVLKSANDLLLKAIVTEVKPTEDPSVNKIIKHEYFTVRLKDGINWYNKTHVIMDNVPMKINLDNNEWSLKPLPLVFEKDKEIIVVTDQDVEKGTELITPRKGGNYTFVRDNGSDLMITNAFDANVAKNDLCTIVLNKFYEEPKMGTLSIKFADKEVVLKEHQEEISKAKYLSSIKKEHQDKVYKEVFGSKNMTPEVVMLSDQPVTHRHRHEHHIRNRRSEYTISSGTRPSSWINGLFGWVKSSVGGLFYSRAVLPEETSSTTSSILQVGAPTDVNGTIMLLDVLIRKVTGQKYISSVENSISLLEAQGYALNIIEEFEEVIKQAAKHNKISMHRLNIDYMEMQKEITRKVMSGKFNEISGILKSYVEKACPDEEAGKLSPKKFEKFIAQFNKGLLNQSIEQILHNRDGRLEVDDAKQMSLEPQSYLSNASVHSHSKDKVSTCLSEIEVTKLRGNLNR